MNNIYELNFDFGWQERIFNVSALIFEERLREIIWNWDLEKLAKAIPYAVSEILQHDKKQEIDLEKTDELCERYWKIIWNLVWLILINQNDVKSDFPDWVNFQYRVNSVEKVSIH